MMAANGGAALHPSDRGVSVMINKGLANPGRIRCPAPIP